MEDGDEAEKSMEIGKGYASSCTDFLYSSTADLPSCQFLFLSEEEKGNDSAIPRAICRGVDISCESMEEKKPKANPYPGRMGPHTGRDPNVKKPGWLRQKAPQGEKYREVKETLSGLKLHTVCEEA
nr:lipoyl synthase, chloroplastic [Ipomoea batatas]